MQASGGQGLAKAAVVVLVGDLAKTKLLRDGIVIGVEVMVIVFPPSRIVFNMDRLAPRTTRLAPGERSPFLPMWRPGRTHR